MNRLELTIGVTLLASGLVLCGCSVEKQRARCPVTTTSEAARAAYQKGRDLLDAERPADALPLFADAVQQDPDFALAWLGQAEAAPRTKLGLDALARAAALAEHVSEGERRMIQGLEAGLKGDLRVQFEHYSTLVRLYPDDERAHTLLAGNQLASQSYAPALTALSQANRIAPDYAPAYLLLARVQGAKGSADEARAAVDEYIKRRPAEPVGYTVRGDLHMKAGDFDGSSQAYREALAHDPRFAQAHVGLGVDQLLLGRPDEARATFAKLGENARDDPDRRLALLWAGLGHVFVGEYEQALDPLRQRLALAERAGDAEGAACDHEWLGDVLLEAKRIDDAAAEYGAATAAVEHTDLPDSLKLPVLTRQPYHEARLALARGDVKSAEAKALEYRERATRAGIPGETLRNQELIGEVKLRAGDPAGAARTLQRLGQNARALWLTASALQITGNYDRAVIPCREAAQFNAPDPAFAFVHAKAAALLPELERQAAANPRRRPEPGAGDHRERAGTPSRQVAAPPPSRAEREAAARQRQAAAKQQSAAPDPRRPAGR